MESRLKCWSATLYQNPKWQARLKWLAPAGRMALTNYLSQSVICLLIFNSFGLGLIGKVRPAPAALIALVIFSFQIFLSRWGLRHLRFGPTEWLWRSLTYAKRQPLRLQTIRDAGYSTNYADTERNVHRVLKDGSVIKHP